MKLTEILAGWIIFQLLVIGLAFGTKVNDYIDCVPNDHFEAYKDSGFGAVFASTVFPIAFFVPDTEAPEVDGCPQISATSTSAIK